MKNLSDVELMGIVADDARGVSVCDAAFAELVERYRNVLLNFFVRKSVSPIEGEDLVQRTFLRLWRYRHNYTTGSAKFTTFLFLLAGQVAIDYFREERSRKNLERGYAEEMEAVSGERAARREGVPDTLPDAALGDDVSRAMAGLSPALRDVVELGVFQDLPYADISGILGIPIGTVKSRMFNALKKLKELLNEH